MKLTIEIYKTQFSNEDSKEAYLKACKWLAKHIISKVEFKDVLYTMEKHYVNELPTFEITLYAVLDDTDDVKRICESCTEFHRSFYVNTQFNCNKCNMQAYRNQMIEKLETKKKYKLKIT